MNAQNIFSNALEFRWDALGADDWQALVAKAGKSSLQQSWAYGEALKIHGAEVHRVAIRLDGRFIAIVQIVKRSFLKYLRGYFIFRGPLWLDESVARENQDQLMRILRGRFKRWRGEFLFWMPEGGPHIPKAGMKQVFTGYGTAWLDLRPAGQALSENLRANWRNKVRKARKSGIETRFSQGNSEDLVWLLGQEHEQRQSRKYYGVPLTVVNAFVDLAGETEQVLVAVACRGDERLAGVLMIRHGASATYYTGWCGDEGRAAGAHNLCLWNALLAVKQQGVDWLDLGGIDTLREPGIAHFKTGTGAVPARLPGTFH